jgi:hypothetical protein
MIKSIWIFPIILLFSLSSCYVPPETRKSDKKTESETTAGAKSRIKASKSVKIPVEQGLTPITGESVFTNPDTIIYVSEVGQQFEVKTGQEVNFIYGEDVDPEETYFAYESTYDGYILTLKEKNEPVEIEFKRMCQIFIVAGPDLTSVKVPENLRYEQIIWTPRQDGTWEVRIGTTERGCKSKALHELKKLRTQQYEKSLPR